MMDYPEEDVLTPEQQAEIETYHRQIEDITRQVLRDDRRTENALTTLFIDRYEKLLRYVPEWNKWLYWDSRRWKIDDGHTVVLKLVREFVESLWKVFQSAPELIGSDEDAKRRLSEILAFVRKSNSMRSIEAVVKLGRADDRVIVSYKELNCHPYLLNVQNGTVDLRSGTKHSHKQTDLITQLAEVEFRADVHCPKWNAAVQLIFNNDEEIVRYAQKLVGYTFSGDTGEHILPICFGDGENGKSTFWNPLIQILGDYGFLANESLLMGSKNEHATEKASMYQKRLVAISEPEQNARLRESRVKELTGDDLVTARRMKEDYWTFRRTHNFWMANKYLPQVRGNDLGNWRRIKLITFNVRI